MLLRPAPATSRGTCVVVVSCSRCSRCLSRTRKRHALAILENERLASLRDHGVHHRAVPVSIHVRLATLVRPTPSHSTNLFARQYPLGKAIKGCPEALHQVRCHQIDEGIAQASLRVEVDWKIDEVVLACEPFRVQHCEQHVTGVVVRQISEHHRRPFLNTHQRHLFGLCCFFGAGLTLRASNTLLLVLLPLRLTITRKFTVPLGVESILHVTEAPTITRSRRARCTNHHVWASLIPCRDMPRAWRNTL
mmetsp:Transcript_72839/g.189121  ORF Transcript_72839/g.189121 Transcript_72839/m.189121 type:complete len:249 (+) Transcript_72839:616-1362(+)